MIKDIKNLKCISGKIVKYKNKRGNDINLRIND